LDEASAAELTGVATPWVLGSVEWTEPLVKRAVLWLCQQTGKALLKLDGDDFRQYNLHQLLRDHGPSARLSHRVFRWMMDTIEYHPGGRQPRRVLCFSPHPDDDVISMGGTLIRLVEDQHDVHVAYMTSGNIAVFDHDARRIADLVAEFNRSFEIDVEKSPGLEAAVLKALGSKVPGDPDQPEVLRIKALIRWSEAKNAASVCGCKEENLHFLDLPFYQTGTIAKRPITAADVAKVRELLERLRPDQVFVAGDLSDPHGTHRLCAQAVFRAIAEMGWEKGPEVLLYRGAWQEWPLHQIDKAVPLSPEDIKCKRTAIFRHQSQKDTALFPGPDDPREFWERAEDRNRHTADLYNAIGLPEYYAMEAFVRWPHNDLG
jgi:glucosamine-6-phosphate deaminase